MFSELIFKESKGPSLKPVDSSKQCNALDLEGMWLIGCASRLPGEGASPLHQSPLGFPTAHLIPGGLSPRIRQREDGREPIHLRPAYVKQKGKGTVYNLNRTVLWKVRCK